MNYSSEYISPTLSQGSEILRVFAVYSLQLTCTLVILNKPGFLLSNLDFCHSYEFGTQKFLATPTSVSLSRDYCQVTRPPFNCDSHLPGIVS